MTYSYIVSGMTCESCKAKVVKILENVPNVSDVMIDLKSGRTTIESSMPISLAELQIAFKNTSYQITEEASHTAHTLSETKSWMATYKPVLLLFVLILLISVIASIEVTTIHYEKTMRFFMAGFFIAFSYFKFLDIKSFMDAYAMYDIVAKKIKVWGAIYPFVELGLGIAYILNYNPVVTNIITLIVMSISIIGVLQSVMNKKQIRCACLGSVFHLPMSTLTIIEDGLMIVMSGFMLML